jgi:hypothetical protein
MERMNYRKYSVYSPAVRSTKGVWEFWQKLYVRPVGNAHSDRLFSMLWYAIWVVADDNMLIVTLQTLISCFNLLVVVDDLGLDDGTSKQRASL